MKKGQRLNREPRQSVAIRLDQQRLVVDAAASKVRKRRILRLNETALRWLSRDARTAGPVVSSHATLRRARRALCRAFALRWPQDVLRHTYASMRLAGGTPAAFVAAEMGTSERMLGEHYREIVEESVAERFWDLRP